MAKKKGQKVAGATNRQPTEQVTLADQLQTDVLAKLAATKKQLTQDAKAQALAQEEQARKERKAREKNMTFEELLDQYGDQGSKF